MCFLSTPYHSRQTRADESAFTCSAICEQDTKTIFSMIVLLVDDMRMFFVDGTSPTRSVSLGVSHFEVMNRPS